MSGIAGVAGSAEKPLVERMLDKLAHRGTGGRKVFESPSGAVGIVLSAFQAAAGPGGEQTAVSDEAGPGHFARARLTEDGLLLDRDPLGVAPLYYGRAAGGKLAFASEVKALLVATTDVHELPPGHRHDGRRMERCFELRADPPVADAPEQIALELRRRLETAVGKCLSGGEAGAWLSGGIDSSAMAALARPRARSLHTFAAGLAGAPDLEYARLAADFLKTEHHEAIVSMQDMLAALPLVIYHLESFDALLLRSSVLNYFVGRAAAEYVPLALSGEGGDELFAGYDYLKSLNLAQVPDELLDITGRLHNTALQRVDRSASAHGLVAHPAFCDPDVVCYALRIPAEHKIRDGLEKWILRKAMAGALPEQVLERRKAKFWEGAGVGEMLSRRADELVSDADFRRQRRLPNGWLLNTKEELMYYRIFREQLGEVRDLEWMGRTKGAPSVALEEGK